MTSRRDTVRTGSSQPAGTSKGSNASSTRKASSKRGSVAADKQEILKILQTRLGNGSMINGSFATTRRHSSDMSNTSEVKAGDEAHRQDQEASDSKPGSSMEHRHSAIEFPRVKFNAAVNIMRDKGTSFTRCRCTARRSSAEVRPPRLLRRPPAPGQAPALLLFRSIAHRDRPRLAGMAGSGA